MSHSFTNSFYKSMVGLYSLSAACHPHSKHTSLLQPVCHTGMERLCQMFATSLMRVRNEVEQVLSGGCLQLYCEYFVRQVAPQRVKLTHHTHHLLKSTEPGSKIRPSLQAVHMEPVFILHRYIKIVICIVVMTSFYGNEFKHVHSSGFVDACV